MELCWLSVDPVTHFSQSPYNAFDSNPVIFSDPSGADSIGWAANTAYLNSSLGSSSNWGQSAVGGDALGYMSAFESSAFTTSNSSTISGIIGYYAHQSGFSGFSFIYNNTDKNISSPGNLGVGFYQYKTGGSGIGGLGITGAQPSNNLAAGILGFIAMDVAIPDPTDVAWPKWAGYAVVGGAAAAYLYSDGIVAKMQREIDRIYERAAGPPGYQYALIANTSGYYPIMTLGSSVSTGTVYLNAGEVWKYGETTSLSRYQETYLRSIGVGGVKEVKQFIGNQLQIKVQEKIMIYNYFFTHGQLPAGNKIFR